MSMFRSLAATLAMLIGLLLSAAPVAADDPTVFGTGGESPGDRTILSLTPEQAQSRTLKAQLIARVPSTPNAATDALASRTDNRTTARSFDEMMTTTAATSWSLSVHPRQQTKKYYCGPAVVQVVSNYAWVISYQTNKYSQQTISDTWTKTDATGQTYIGNEVAGMNGATAGSSRRPGGFVYAQLNGATFTTWHNTIVSGVYDWRMPLAAGVIPRKSGATYFLTSWNIVSNGGHYIELHGYDGLSSSTSKYVWYSDTAGSYASSVANNYKQASFAVYQTMVYNNHNVIY